jgi:G:T-mismatch repair DNA endonuclease (very short patch repair protein)
MAVSNYNRSFTSHQSRRSSRNGLALRSQTVENTTPDIVFANHGSVVLIHGVSPAGQLWLDTNVGDSETHFWGGAVVCEPRYVEAIYRGAIESGLVCR